MIALTDAQQELVERARTVAQTELRPYTADGGRDPAPAVPRGASPMIDTAVDLLTVSSREGA